MIAKIQCTPSLQYYILYFRVWLRYMVHITGIGQRTKGYTTRLTTHHYRC